MTSDPRPRELSDLGRPHAVHGFLLRGVPQLDAPVINDSLYDSLYDSCDSLTHPSSPPLAMTESPAVSTCITGYSIIDRIKYYYRVDEARVP